MRNFLIYFYVGLSATFAAMATKNMIVFFVIIFGLYAVLGTIELAKEEIIKNIKSKR